MVYGLGIAMSQVSHIVSKKIANDDTAFEISLQVLTGMMTVAGVLVAGLHGYVHYLTDIEKADKKKVLMSTSAGRAALTEKQNRINARNSKPKLSFVESLKVLSGDKYLRNIAIMVLSYGLAIEFTEIIWKASVKSFFPVKSEYLNFMGKYSTYVGIASFICTFIGTKVNR